MPPKKKPADSESEPNSASSGEVQKKKPAADRKKAGAKAKAKQEPVEEVPSLSSIKFDTDAILAQAVKNAEANQQNKAAIAAFHMETLLTLDTTDSMVSGLSQRSPGLPISRLSLSDDESNQRRDSDDYFKMLENKKKEGANGIGLLHSAIDGAERVLTSTTFKDIERNKCMLKVPSKGLQNIGANLLYPFLNSALDMKLLLGSYSQAELWLMGSPLFKLDDMYFRAIAAIREHAVQAAVQEREESTERPYEGPSVHQCLAWLARAAQCTVEALVPPGEQYTEAVEYLATKFGNSNLQLFPSKDQRIPWALQQTTKMLRLISAADLRGMKDDDRCVVIFAVARLYIDDKATATDALTVAAGAAWNKLLSSAESVASLVQTLCDFVPYIAPDSAPLTEKALSGLRSSSGAPPYLLTALVAAYFVHVSERAECWPDIDESSAGSAKALLRAYLAAFLDTFRDAFKALHNERDKRAHRALIGMANIALSLDAIRVMTEDQKYQMGKDILHVKMSYVKADRPDDAMVHTELQALARRIEKLPSEKSVRRTPQQVAEERAENERAIEERNAEKRAAINAKRMATIKARKEKEKMEAAEMEKKMKMTMD